MKQEYKLVALLALILPVLLVTGCSKTKPAIKDVSLVEASYIAADTLMKRVETDEFLRFDLQRSKPLIVASFVNIDDLLDTSTFGRMAAEQVGSRFAQHGYKVSELKLRTTNIFIEQRRGELALSRELKNISTEHNAQAIIAGTYAKAADVVYVTAKIIRASDGTIIASHDYSLPIGPNVRTMLKVNKR